MLADLDAAIRKLCPIIGVFQTLEGDFGVNFAASATDEQKRDAFEILANWVEPPEPRLVFSLDFLDRFPESVQLSIVSFAQSNPTIRLWYDRLLAAQQVDLNSPRLRAGLEAMQAAGLLTAEQIADALA
jgi:hypothetical protein